ncbi:hypothetical protein VRK_00360 [Vibrio sp. MEBiC08052]|nr:hypothetical protein VRK_00360 [Vibrio sp. MEBiC08052]
MHSIYLTMTNNKLTKSTESFFGYQSLFCCAPVSVLRAWQTASTPSVSEYGVKTDYFQERKRIKNNRLTHAARLRMRG